MPITDEVTHKSSQEKVDNAQYKLEAAQAKHKEFKEVAAVIACAAGPCALLTVPFLIKNKAAVQSAKVDVKIAQVKQSLFRK